MLGWACQSKVAPSAASDFSSAGCLPPQVRGARQRALRWDGVVCQAKQLAWLGGHGQPCTRRGTQSASQPLPKCRLSVTHQVSDASSLSHGVHTFSTGQECQHVMKGLIHGGWQRRRSWSSSRYDPDGCWWGSFKMGTIIKCPCAFLKFLSGSHTHRHRLFSPAQSLSPSSMYLILIVSTSHWRALETNYTWVEAEQKNNLLSETFHYGFFRIWKFWWNIMHE